MQTVTCIYGQIVEYISSRIRKQERRWRCHSPLKPLTGTDRLGNSSHRGLQKQWTLKSSTDDALHWDYIQKVNNAVQDFNESVSDKASLTREGIVFAITLVDWINDAVEKVLQCYRDDIVVGFSFAQQDELGRMREFFRAVWSFVNAHPLGTDRHGVFGFDGTDLADVRQVAELRIDKLYELDVYLGCLKKKNYQTRSPSDCIRNIGL